MAVEAIEDARVEAGFARVRREDFLGPGLWPVLRWTSRYVTTPSADPVYLYTEDAVASCRSAGSTTACRPFNKRRLSPR
jgi:protein-L-isoaspartate(D-aspartate) O-methyltransferase